VKGCDACQHNKNHTKQPAGKLMPNSIPEKPWTLLQMVTYLFVIGALES